MNRIFAALLATIMATQALAQPYVGKWAVDGDCQPKTSDTPWNFLKVTSIGFKGYEYGCIFNTVRPTGIIEQWDVEASCVNEGDAYADTFQLETTAHGRALMVTRPKEVITYERCE